SDFANYARGPALKLSHLDLHHLIKEVLGLYEANAIPIVLKLEAQRSEVNGDATRLRQVIHNLLQNAQDALQGMTQPQITLSTEALGSKIHLLIEDRGMGFPESVLARAFEPYRTTKTKGTGLGLAIVKKIVEEHGGHIAIENSLNGGARVSIFFPLVEES
ncbi:MAG: ATP-binding protein, partial [Gallionella sp.]|nr:ATP-binding protein [Gallionella sp.]